jgi:hypothetical protein
MYVIILVSTNRVKKEKRRYGDYSGIGDDLNEEDINQMFLDTYE